MSLDRYPPDRPIEPIEQAAADAALELLELQRESSSGVDDSADWDEADDLPDDLEDVYRCHWCGDAVEHDELDQVCVGKCSEDLICAVCWARWERVTEHLRVRIRTARTSTKLDWGS